MNVNFVAALFIFEGWIGEEETRLKTFLTLYQMWYGENKTNEYVQYSSMQSSSFVSKNL